MAATVLYIADLMLWCFMAVSVLYVFFFALSSLLPAKKPTAHPPITPSPRSHEAVSFLVLFPAYSEDRVIVDSVETILRQDYPKELYHVAVISDNMLEETNRQLATMPITLLTPSFDNSSKAKSLQYAIKNLEPLQTVVVLDADNHVPVDFLSRLSSLCQQGHRAIQCHRTAKNSDNHIAVLDGVSEEINNSLFRRGHNRIGLSSALIGSGMCFSYQWFAEHVDLLDSAVEDRELEAMLMKEGVHVHYAEDIYVMDEKVSSGDNFQRQRLRWMTGQVQTLVRMLPHVPHAICHGNVDYLDKTLQQALIPRSLLLVFIPILAIITTIVSLFTHIPLFIPLKWWGLQAVLCLSLYLAIPAKLRTGAVLRKVLQVPFLVWRMVKNVGQISTRNKEFIHTSHGE